MTTDSVGPNSPYLDGIFHYSLGASEIVQLGYYGPGDVTHSTMFSGDSAYTSKSATSRSACFSGAALLWETSPGRKRPVT